MRVYDRKNKHNHMVRLKKHYKKMSSDDGVTSLPDDMVHCILEYCCYYDISKQIQLVNHQWKIQSDSYVLNHLSKRYALFGGYRYDLVCHELELIQMIVLKQVKRLGDQFSIDNKSAISLCDFISQFEGVSECWNSGMNCFKYHSVFLPFDSLYIYPVMWPFIVCWDIETLVKLKWKFDLSSCISDTLQSIKQIIHNDKYLFILINCCTTDILCCIRKKDGILVFSFNCMNVIISQGNTHPKIDTMVLTPCSIVLSVYKNDAHAMLIRIDLENFTERKLINWNRLNTTFNLMITDMENDYSQKQNSSGHVFFDIRPQGTHVIFTSLDLSIEEDVEDSHKFNYSIPIANGARNIQVELTSIGSEYWIFSGMDDKRRLRTELVELKTGLKIENTIMPTAMYMVEDNGKLIGLISYSGTNLSYCAVKNQTVVEMWSTNHALSEFSYKPNVQTLYFNDRLYVLLAGGDGVFVLCLDISTGQIIWQDTVVKKEGTVSHFSHFDLYFNLKRDLCEKSNFKSVFVCGTVKEMAFFFLEYDASTGNIKGSRSDSWQSHLKALPSLTKQILDECNHSTMPSEEVTIRRNKCIIS